MPFHSNFMNLEFCTQIPYSIFFTKDHYIITHSLTYFFGHGFTLLYYPMRRVVVSSSYLNHFIPLFIKMNWIDMEWCRSARPFLRILQTSFISPTPSFFAWFSVRIVGTVDKICFHYILVTYFFRACKIIFM